LTPGARRSHSHRPGCARGKRSGQDGGPLAGSSVVGLLQSAASRTALPTTAMPTSRRRISPSPFPGPFLFLTVLLLPGCGHLQKRQQDPCHLRLAVISRECPYPQGVHAIKRHERGIAGQGSTRLVSRSHHSCSAPQRGSRRRTRSERAVRTDTVRGDLHLRTPPPPCHHAECNDGMERTLIRTQIQFSPEQLARTRDLALAVGVSAAEVVRRSVDYCVENNAASRGERTTRLQAAGRRRLSLPDCVSFEIMRRNGCATAFALIRTSRSTGSKATRSTQRRR
jgi:hypothetical protein